MADLKLSTLPPVLKEYLPDYEPKIPEESHSARRACKAVKQQQQLKDSKEERQDQPNRGVPSQSSQEPKPLQHEDTNISLKSSKSRSELETRQNEQYKKNYEYWQIAKSESKETQHQQLIRKLALQRELIRAQDEYAYQRRELERVEHAKLREAEKHSKHSREEALQKICKKSLDEDRKKARHLRPRKSTTSSKSPHAETTSSQGSSDLKDFTAEVKTKAMGTDTITQPHVISPVPEGVSPTPQDAELDGSFELTEEQLDTLPWHHVQLYRLYGRKANDYLHPKMEHKPIANINPKLRRQGGKNKKGRAGADVLWNALREDSKLRLLKEDTHISRDLKAAYGAFVRQLLARHKVPVKRNFYAEDDVPEMAVLMDQTILNRTRDVRHKVELMFRSSVNNEDRAKILSFNNPIPDFNNFYGEESIDRYLPSWVEPDDSSVYDSSKWTRPRLSLQGSRKGSVPSQSNLGNIETNRSEIKPSNPEGAVKTERLHENEHRSITAPSLGDQAGATEEWDFMLVKKKSKPKSSQPKIHFVTESDLKCKGEFSKRRKELNNSKSIPPAFDDFSKSAMGIMSSERVVTPSAEKYDVPVPPKACSAPPLTEAEYLRRYTSTWEPLSLNALEEYKEVARVFGNGDFRQGTTQMWKTTRAS